MILEGVMGLDSVASPLDILEDVNDLSIELWCVLLVCAVACAASIESFRILGEWELVIATGNGVEQ